MFLTSTQRSTCIGLLFLLISICTHATVVIKGDSKSPTESFAHPIQTFAMNNRGLLYVGTHKGEAKDFALSLVNTQNLDFKVLIEGDGQSEQEFVPLATKKATINGQKDMANPLYNSNISYMASITKELMLNQSNNLAVVTKAKPASIYLIELINNGSAQMLSIEHLNDASGTHKTASIIQMAASSSQMIYAAVTDAEHNASFGEGNSGIAIITLQEKQPENKTQEKKDEQSEQDKKQKTDNQMNLIQIDFRATHTNKEQPRAIPLNNESNVFRIGKPTIKILNNAVNFDMIASTDVLYIALNVQAQGNSAEGTQGIVIGYWEKIIFKIPVDNTQKNDPKKNTKKDKRASQEGKKKQEYLTKHIFNYQLKSITSPAAFEPNVNNIVGGIGSDITVSIHQTKSMFTSTLLDYIIILGGVGQPEQTRHNVYALPLVKSHDLLNGLLAKKGTEPVTNYAAQTRIAGRAFTQAALQPGDLYTADDVEVQVGHGPMNEGKITSIMTYGDTVYAVVNSAGTGHASGIYQSQALFDPLGRIKEWTSWRRVYSSITDHIYGAGLNQTTGTLVMLTGDSDDNIRTVKRTSWNPQPEGYSKNLSTWLNTVFPQEQSGIQGLFDFPVSTPGLKNISLLCATGYKQIALAQTGTKENDIFNPMPQQQLVYDPAYYSNGTIDAELSYETNAIVVKGGALDELTIIKAATITHVGNAGYIFVGGTNGLALLANNRGYSFDADSGLGHNLSGLCAGATFKKIGSYSFIRKLICDHEYGLLYVISDTQLDRIDLRASDFTTGNLAATTLVTYNKNNSGMLFDAVISRFLGIIATSKGLYYTAPGTDIRTAQGYTDLPWQHVELPEGLPTARQLFCITVSGHEQDITSGTGGNLYVLNTDQSIQKAQVYRFTINVTNPDHCTLELLPDYFVKDVPSCFAQLSSYRTWIYNDGSLFFSERDKHSENNPVLMLLSPHHRCYQKFGINGQTNVPVNLRDSSIIQPIVRSSASGSWLLAQNTMFSVNE